MAHQHEIRHIEAFLAVAEELHFGRAARRLHVAQPALSRTVRQLEDDLGFPLLRRTTRAVTLTPAGREFAGRAAVVLTARDAAARAAADVARGLTGRLRVGVSGPTPLRIVAPALRRFGDSRPPWRVDVTEMPTTMQVSALVTGDLDVGLFLGEASVPASVATRVVARDRMHVGLPRGHRLATRPVVRMSELAEDRLVLFPRERNPVLYDETIAAVSAGGSRHVDVVEAPSRQIAAGLVAAGLGVSTFGESMRLLCGDDVVLVPQAEPEKTVEVVMGWPADAGNPLLAHLDPDPEPSTAALDA